MASSTSSEHHREYPRRVNHPASQYTRPPLWLAAAAIAAVYGAAYAIGRWIVLFAAHPVHEDFRIFYVAAKAGLAYGWARIYDAETLRSLLVSFPPGQTYIDSSVPFISPPLLAWLIVPFTAFPPDIAYVLWSLVSLGALVWAWYISAPWSGIRKAAMLLAGLAVWPVLDSFYYGQPSILVLALVATAWWFCSRKQDLAAGVALALATAIKPQAMVLVPLALLVSGRYRPVAAWAAGCLVLAVASFAALGPNGLAAWWGSLQYAQSNGGHSFFTLAYLFGREPITYALEALQGIVALVIARVRRSRLEIVFAVGLLGSLVSSFHLHQPDYSSLLLAAWLVLRTSPPLWHRLWLLAGFFTMQAVTLGQPLPQVLWDAGWLVILGVSSFYGSGASDPATRSPAASGARAGT
jgi:hypothetical protein